MPRKSDRSRNAFGLLTRHAAAESEAERDAVRLEHATAVEVPWQFRALLAASVSLLYGLAALAAAVSTQGSLRIVTTALGLLLTDPLVWDLVRGTRAERLRWYWGPVAGQAVFCLIALLGFRLEASAILLLLAAPLLAGGLFPRKPDFRAPLLASLAVAALPLNPLAWMFLIVSVVLPLARRVALGIREREAGRRDAVRIEILEQRMLMLRGGQQAAFLDPLTGVLNRRGFDAEATRLFNYAYLGQRHLGVMMLDIDHFKAVNDTYGHDMGDRALQAFSKLVSGSIRPQADVFARLGGEEFALITDDLSGAEDLHAFAERVRKVVESTPWGRDAAGNDLHYTCSIGYAVYPDCGSHGIDDMLVLADKALYHGKESGRNRSVGYQDAAGVQTPKS